MTLGRDSVFVVTGAAGGSRAPSSRISRPPAAARSTCSISCRRRRATTRRIAPSGRIASNSSGADRRSPSAGREADPGPDRSAASRHRASDAALRSIEAVEARRRDGPLPAVDLLDGGRVDGVVAGDRRAARPDRRARARGRHRDQPEPGREGRPRSSIACSTSRPTGSSPAAGSAACPIGATYRVQLGRRAFGNTGQTDYSAANELLCACRGTARARARRPVRSRSTGRPGAASGWPPADRFRRSWRPRASRCSRRRSGFPPPARVDRRRHRRRDRRRRAPRHARRASGRDRRPGRRRGRPRGSRRRDALPDGRVASSAKKLYGGLEVATRLDPPAQPFLLDHQIESTPVLPASWAPRRSPRSRACSVAAASCRVSTTCRSCCPSSSTGCSRPRFGSRRAGCRPGTGGVAMHVALKSRVQPKPELPVQERVHFAATVRLTQQATTAPSVAFTKPKLREFGVNDGEIRAHPRTASKVLERVRCGRLRAVGLMVTGLPPDASPARAGWLVSPRLHRAVLPDRRHP